MNHTRLWIIAMLALAVFLAGCVAPRPVREKEETTRRVVSEEPVLGK